VCKCCVLQCPFSRNFSRSLLVGIKLEVINTHTEITEYPVYWMASVVDVAGMYIMFLTYLSAYGNLCFAFTDHISDPAEPLVPCLCVRVACWLTQSGPCFMVRMIGHTSRSWDDRCRSG